MNVLLHMDVTLYGAELPCRTINQPDIDHLFEKCYIIVVANYLIRKISYLGILWIIKNL